MEKWQEDFEVTLVLPPASVPVEREDFESTTVKINSD